MGERDIREMANISQFALFSVNHIVTVNLKFRSEKIILIQKPNYEQKIIQGCHSILPARRMEVPSPPQI